MIPINTEPHEFYLNTKVYEKCVFCNSPTNTWHHKTNKPVCADCAKTHNESELGLPEKVEVPIATIIEDWERTEQYKNEQK